MNAVIRDAGSEDAEAIVRLMREFAELAKLGKYLDIDGGRLSGVLFKRNAFVKCIVAEIEGHTVGYAIFYPAFSSFRCQEGLYLEDIFVTADARGSNIGVAMLREIAGRAVAGGYSRLDLLVDIRNHGARRFYARHGAAVNEDDRHYKFDAEAFAVLAGNTAE